MALYPDKAACRGRGVSGGVDLLKGMQSAPDLGGWVTGSGSMLTWCVLGTKSTHKQMLKSHYAHTVPSNIIHSGTNWHFSFF